LFNSQLNTIIIPSQKATPMNIRGVLFNVSVDECLPRSVVSR